MSRKCLDCYECDCTCTGSCDERCSCQRMGRRPVSGILSGLRIQDPSDAADSAWNDCLDHVAEALRSDKWKRLIAADLCEHEGVGKACIDCTFKAESVQELLAGGDDE